MGCQHLPRRESFDVQRSDSRPQAPPCTEQGNTSMTISRYTPDSHRSLWRLTCLISAVMVGVFEPAASNAEPSSPVPVPPAGGGVVTLQDLLVAPVPALCQHDPGNL